MVGICQVTKSHHNHRGQKPTIVGFCHGGNVPISHEDDEDDEDDEDENDEDENDEDENNEDEHNKDDKDEDDEDYEDDEDD